MASSAPARTLEWARLARCGVPWQFSRSALDQPMTACRTHLWAGRPIVTSPARLVSSNVGLALFDMLPYGNCELEDARKTDEGPFSESDSSGLYRSANDRLR